MALLIIAFILMLVGAYWAFMSRRQHKINLMISDELNNLIGRTAETIQKTKKTIADERLGKAPSATPNDLFDSPGLMATIITVLVHKYGTVRLSVNDFMIPDSEYVSVYVDGTTQEIILSLDHNLTIDSALSAMAKTDDSTFH